MTTHTDHAPARAARHDLYAAVHKGLRAFLSDTLVAVGATDPGDHRACARAAASVRRLAALCAQHLREEDVFLESALAARVGRAGRTTADEHRAHEAAIASLVARADAAEGAAEAVRCAAMEALYLELADFVADNLAHMAREERENNPALWSAFTDDELRAIEGELVAQIPPERMDDFLAWMLPALHHGERVGMLRELRAGAPPEVFAHVMGIAEGRLAGRDFASLRASLT